MGWTRGRIFAVILVRCPLVIGLVPRPTASNGRSRTPTRPDRNRRALRSGFSRLPPLCLPSEGTTVYRRFATKDELIYEVYADRLRAGEDLARRAAAEPDAWRGFVEFFEESIEILANDRGLRDLTIGGYTRSLGWARGTTPDRLARLLSDNGQTMGVHLTEVVRRAKKAGRLRRDFEATDMMVLSIAVQATIAFGGTEHPELYRRSLGFILDGLHPSRSGVTPLPAPALTGADLPQARRRR